MASKLNYITIDLILLTTLCMCSCTKYNYVDGGTANGIHNCSMWEYFESHLTDWDSTMIMIEHAGLKTHFEGKRRLRSDFIFRSHEFKYCPFHLGP